MYITVKQFLQYDCCQGIQTVAGHKGLDRMIRCVDIIEVPDTEGWLKEGGFYLTAGYAVKDSPEAQLQLIRSLAAAQAAALAVKKGRYLPELSPELLECADAHELPVLTIPKAIPYLDITVPALTSILQHQTLLLQQTERIHRQFTDIFLTGGDQKTLASALAHLVGKAVLVQDAAGRILVWASGDKDGPWHGELESPEGLRDLFRENLQPRFCLTQDGTGRLAAPVVISGRIFGYISLLSPGGSEFNDFDAKALEQASLILALEMLKEKEKAEIAARLQSDLLEDLLSGNFESTTAIIRRGQHFGWDFNGDYVLMILDIDDFERCYLELPNKDERFIQGIKEQIRDTAANALTAVKRQHILVNKSDSLVLFVRLHKESDSTDAICALAELLQKALSQKFPQLSISIGIGNYYPGVDGLQKSYDQASRAIIIGRAAFGKGAVYHFSRLGLFKLLASLKDNEHLKAFYDETIVRLPVSGRQEMLAAVKALIEHGGNKTHAARSLFIHRNSLNYRLNKLEQILGSTEKNMADWLELYLAAKIEQVLTDIQ